MKVKILSFITIVCLIIGFSGCSKVSTKSSSHTKEVSYFEGYTGCFAMYSLKNDEYTFTAYTSEDTLDKRIPPCSTFKIINSLIGLRAGVIKDQNTLFEWDGKERAYESWNKDHTLKTAIANSAVWYYQRLACEVGSEQMQEILNEVNYGNNDISGGIDQFWLQSSLKISPKEQIDMLKRFYNYDLPFTKEQIDIVKDIIVLEEKNDVVLSGKTGTGSDDGKVVNGWFIGYVENHEDTYLFVTNIQGEDNATSSKAKEIALNILSDKKIW
ncbi:hypothetical protein SH1V18_46080 [Vallitalea longa]|uniref:beta-lactamase n=1 Tax=Vallitalea longa TaxID=2936439 RepID=A0A9W5YIV0_9FIRM|nr:penicillin-binding transpeptidase domain-containing protein [Vallitalea longa]GKX32128.1 hypothetical protein SH1V18_46080 [Vallitalea longa]